MDSKDNLILELHEQLIEKEQKINELRDRIDKAIEYIEKHSNSFSVLDTISNAKLLEILKGE